MESGERIRAAREAQGMSQADLAKRVGISQPAIKKIEAGDTQHSKFLPRIAQTLGLKLEDLDPVLARGLPVTIPPLLSRDRDFPIHASAEGGPGQIIVSSDAVDFDFRPAPLSHVRDAYGLLISNTSMEPEYRPGDTALVHPHLPVVADEVYIFYAEREGVARATIKHLRRVTIDKWHVTQWNPPPGMERDFTLSRKEWQWAHRVLGKYARR
jgi:transcriptional regulator with XRE-family HTH domain